MHEARAGAMVLLAIDHFLASCVQQNDTITADAKCATIAPQQDHSGDTQWSDHFLTSCLWQEDVIRVHAKCQTHIADNDFFPVHRQLVKDGILLYLQKYFSQKIK